MDMVKVDIQKLQLLNDRIAQTLEALEQVRQSVQTTANGIHGQYPVTTVYQPAFQNGFQPTAFQPTAFQPTTFHPTFQPIATVQPFATPYQTAYPTTTPYQTAYPTTIPTTIPQVAQVSPFGYPYGVPTYNTAYNTVPTWPQQAYSPFVATRPWFNTVPHQTIVDPWQGRLVWDPSVRTQGYAVPLS